MISLHIGKIGDTIACMHYFAQQYRLTGQKTDYYFKQNRYFTQASYDFLKPLLDVQPWINKHGLVDAAPGIPPLTQPSLQAAREQQQKYNFYNSQYQAQRWWQYQAGIKHQTDQLRTRLEKAYHILYDKTFPFLSVPDKVLLDGDYIVIGCTGNYHCLTDYTPLDKLPYRKIFIGTQQQYKQWGQKYQYYKVKDALQAAQLIKHAKFYVGGQSSLYWIAEGLGANRILMASQSWPTVTPQVLSDVMLRVTTVQQLDRAVDIMLKKIKVGYIITTYGTPAYVQLQIKQHKKWNHDIVIVDDCSSDSQLQELGKKYNIPVLNVHGQRKGHQYGDWNSTLIGLQWFKDYDYAVKISRRCLWLHDKGLSIAAYEQKPLLTDWWIPYAAYKHKALHSGCVVYNMHLCKQAIQKMYSITPQRNHYVQICLGDVFRSCYGQYPFFAWRQVYTKQGRQQFPRDILWKTSDVQEYKKLLPQYSDIAFQVKEDMP